MRVRQRSKVHPPLNPPGVSEECRRSILIVAVSPLTDATAVLCYQFHVHGFIFWLLYMIKTRQRTFKVWKLFWRDWHVIKWKIKFSHVQVQLIDLKRWQVPPCLLLFSTVSLTTYRPQGRNNRTCLALGQVRKQSGFWRFPEGLSLCCLIKVTLQ